MADRPWFSDEGINSQLNQRILDGNFFIIVNDKIPGKVIKIIYAGYKILLPNDSEMTVYPLKDNIVDLNEEAYLLAVEQWKSDNEKEKARLEEIKKNHDAFLLKQKLCKHDQTTKNQVVKAAGCDIYDTNCNICNKILQRSWSTAYDNDPDDEISDWDWWEREASRLYNGWKPEKKNYKIVENISPF